MGDRLFEDYLGDGLYVYHDGWHVWLYTSNGVSETNRVALEPGVLGRLQDWLERVRTELSGEEDADGE